MRGGNCKPRPGWKQRPLVFAQGCKTPFEKGFFHPAAIVYNGPTSDSVLTSHGGRQFKIDIDSSPGPLTTTNGNFTIPAVNATVAVTVLSTINIYSQETEITIGNYKLTLVSVDSLTQITVKNTITANAGIIVASGSSVQFIGAWETSEITVKIADDTKTTANFTIPAVGATVNVSVQDATRFVGQLPSLVIGGKTLILISVNSPVSITVQNNEVANVGVVVTQPADIAFNVFDANNPNNQMNWSLQAENYWVLQDNRSFPVIFDGSKSFRANPALSQIPVGNVMCYAMGRIAVALPDRQSYRIGDIIFGLSGTAANNGKDAILYFTENNYLNEGGDLVARVFGAPSNSGNIYSMKASAMTDSSLGQGAMLVGTPNVVFSVNLPFDRTQWKNMVNPLQSVNPIIGPTSQNGTVLVNTDQWYRSLDGIRSYILAQRQFNGSPGNTAQSAEVADVLAFDTNFWLEFGSGVLFDNRLLMTVSPQMTPNGCYHRGLVALDFNLISSLRGKSAPAWEGVWTGIRILQILTGIVNKVPRCFMFVLNDASEIELWEQTTSEKFDNGDTPIAWAPEMPSYNCANSDQFKKLKAGRFIITNLTGTLTGTVQYRSDESSCWNDWYSFSRCAKSQDCSTQACPNDGPITYREQTRYPIRLPEPPDDFDEISKRKKSTGYEHQVRIQMTGFAELKQLRIYAINEPENLGLERTDET
jgi:hypothetical protein